MIGLKEVCAAVATTLLMSGPASVGTLAATRPSASGGTTTVGVKAFGVSVVDPTCKLVLDANHKTLDTPNHMYTDMGGANGKKTGGELITVNGDRYVMVNGKWSKSRMTVAATRAQEEENIKNAKVLSCKQTGDDVVSGEAATVYTEHTENEDTKSDGKIWISKSRGVILKEEIELDSGEATKQHVAIRYEYGNVKAPI
jgi:hypothetical protein